MRVTTSPKHLAGRPDQRTSLEPRQRRDEGAVGRLRRAATRREQPQHAFRAPTQH